MKQRSVSRKTQLLFTIILLVSILLDPGGTAISSARAQKGTPDQLSPSVEPGSTDEFVIKTGNYEIPETLLDALKIKLGEINDASGGATSFGVGYFEEHPRWVWINLLVANGSYFDEAEMGPSFLYFAVRDIDAWRVVFAEDNQDYLSLLDSVSRDGLSPEELELLDQYYELNEPEADLNALAGNLLFPWSSSQNSWRFSSNGFHAAGFTSLGVESGAQAIDLVPPSSAQPAKVLAMETGTVVNKLECTWNTVLIVRHDGFSDSKKFVYLHLQNGTSPLGIGSAITQRGQYLGDLRTPVFNSVCSGSNCEIDNNPSTGNLCSISYGRHLHLGIGTDKNISINGNVVANMTLGGYYNSSNTEGGGGGGSCSAPSLSNPSDGHVSQSQSVSFSWSAVSGCTFNGYTFRIKDTSNMDSGGTTIVDTGEGGTSRTENISSQYNNRDLYWGVRAANAPNGASWSVRRFRIEPGGGGSCNPSADQVALYVDPNYSGACVVRGIGNYSNPGALGIANDSVSSIKVGGNVKLTVCRDDNYASTCETFQGDDSNLSDNSIGNDQVSSAKVESRGGGTPPAEHPIQFYRDAQYGQGYCFGDVAANYTNLDGCPGYDDTISSLVLSSGWSVRVYKDRDLGGTSKCFTSNDDNLSNDTFDDGSGVNDQISSFALYNQASCPAPVPSTPSNFRVSGSTQTSITLAWDNMSNESGYNIYEWNGADFVYLASVGANTTSYTETRGECGWDEFYQVSAYNGSGESERAAWIQGYTKPCNPTLNTPGNGSSNPHNYNLAFEWNYTPGATEYLLEWWGGPYSAMQPCGWSSSTSCAVGTVFPGNTYSWRVKARNSAGESNWSNTWTFTIQPEASPDLVVQSITASPVSPTAGQPVTYTVRIKNQGTGDINSSFYVDLFLDRAPATDCGDSSSIWWGVNSLAAGSTQDLNMTVDGFATSGEHSLYASVDTNCHIGESNDNNNILGPVLLTVKLVQPPLAFSKSSPLNGATGQSTSPTLTWQASSGATSYQYCYDTTNDNACSNWTSNGTSTSKTLSGLNASTIYYWHVRASNSSGNTYSNNSSTTFWSFKTRSAAVKMTFSATADDGWVLESSETSNKGGSMNATATSFVVGDDAGDKQYRGILSFNTAGLPDNAVITGVTFKVMQQSVTGTNPFSTHGNIVMDIFKGAFSGNPALQAGDFQATASKSAVATITNTPSASWYSKALGTGAFTYINKGGVTQIRLRFDMDDNDDLGADFLRFYSGNATAANRPRLVIQYYIP